MFRCPSGLAAGKVEERYRFHALLICRSVELVRLGLFRSFEESGRWFQKFLSFSGRESSAFCTSDRSEGHTYSQNTREQELNAIGENFEKKPNKTERKE